MTAQILRDPRFETFRIFYTQHQRIVHHTAITSRLPGAIYFEKIGHGKHDLDVVVENTKRQVHADSYWVLHNHPSGKAEPSIQDVRLTVYLASHVPGFRGHVVINTNEYSVIDKDGQIDHVHDMGNLAGGYRHNPFKNHELLLEKISSPRDLARIGQALKQRDQFFQLIGVSANSSVMSITELPISVLDRSKNLLLARLQNFSRNSGINAVFAITDSHHFKHPLLGIACMEGILRDVLTVDGAKYRSMQEEAIFPSMGGEVSSCYRKPRSFVTTNDGILKSKGRGMRL